jgi:uncharacterized protein (TIGR02246 family)
MRMIQGLVFVVALSASGASGQTAGDTSLVRVLRDVNAELLRAESARDTARMAELITPDFTWVRYDGARFGRVARLSAVARGVRNPSTPTILEEEGRMVANDVAIGLRRTRLLLGSAENRREREIWETRVYVRSAGRWRVAAQHATAAPDSAAAARPAAAKRRSLVADDRTKDRGNKSARVP